MELEIFSLLSGISFFFFKKIFYYYYYLFFYNRGTFHGQTLRTLHEDPNLGVLITLQQLASGKFRVLLVVGFEFRTMCHLLGPYFLVFALTNWATLVGCYFKHLK